MTSPKIFDKLGMTRPKKSAFDLSREQKLSFKIGRLVPTYLEEVLPGDEFKVKTESLIRLSPLLAPVMHRVNVYLHYFFIPNRILWSDWEHFITGKPTVSGATEPVFPTIQISGSQAQSIGSLADYLGLPTSVDSTTPELFVSQLPFRAYLKIYQDYYMDQNLQENVLLDFDTFPATIAGSHSMRNIRVRNWEKDYFTSALPFAQRGDAVGVAADIDYTDVTQAVFSGSGAPANGPVSAAGGDIQTDLGTIRIENLDGIDIDINELRKSTAVQRWLEKSARGGGRYIEMLLSHFGVKSDDARLQRPEYLGGGRQPIVISEVLNTTGTTEAPQGDMSGHGISAGTTNSFRKSFNEHGYVMGIMSVMPKPSYHQGVQKHWLRDDKLDYYFPEFANLGEQEIKNVEIYANQATAAAREATFGYQQRYAEYKYGNSTVHGNFKGNLFFWHMGRAFSTPPSLNSLFIEMNAEEVENVFATTGLDQVMAQLYHDVKARRPMPFFSDPKLS